MSTTATGPIATWLEVAAIIGRSYPTIYRKRKEKGDTMEPPFRNEDEVWAWWRVLTRRTTEPAASPAPKPKPGGPRVLDGPLDARARRRQKVSGG